MASSLFQNLSPHQNSLNNAMQAVNALRGQNPNALMNMLAQRNPQFAQFVKDNQNKTPDQIAQENGLDISQIKSLFR